MAEPSDRSQEVVDEWCRIALDTLHCKVQKWVTQKTVGQHNVRYAFISATIAFRRAAEGVVEVFFGRILQVSDNAPCWVGKSELDLILEQTLSEKVAWTLGQPCTVLDKFGLTSEQGREVLALAIEVALTSELFAAPVRVQCCGQEYALERVNDRLAVVSLEQAWQEFLQKNADAFAEKAASHPAVYIETLGNEGSEAVKQERPESQAESREKLYKESVARLAFARLVRAFWKSEAFVIPARLYPDSAFAQTIERGKAKFTSQRVAEALDSFLAVLRKSAQFKPSAAGLSTRLAFLSVYDGKFRVVVSAKEKELVIFQDDFIDADMQTNGVSRVMARLCVLAICCSLLYDYPIFYQGLQIAFADGLKAEIHFTQAD